MKKSLIIIIIVLSLTTIIADNPVELHLEKGKNIIIIDEYFKTLYASELIILYPQIESISMKKYGNTFGYVNTLGGIGTNILIESSTEYEIYSKENITIKIN